MGHHNEADVGIDTAKLRNAVAIAEVGRGGGVLYLGDVDARAAPTRNLVARLAASYRKRMSCYDAGPTVCGLQSVRHQHPGDRTSGVTTGGW